MPNTVENEGIDQTKNTMKLRDVMLQFAIFIYFLKGVITELSGIYKYCLTIKIPLL